MATRTINSNMSWQRQLEFCFSRRRRGSHRSQFANSTILTVMKLLLSPPKVVEDPHANSDQLVNLSSKFKVVNFYEQGLPRATYITGIMLFLSPTSSNTTIRVWEASTGMLVATQMTSILSLF